MKNIYYIVAAAVILLFACDRKVEFQHETFITLDNASLSISEGVGVLPLPVSIVNPTGEDVVVTVEDIEGEGETGALKGVNYEIVNPEYGVLTFSGETATQNIEIKIKSVDGLTGSKEFKLKIASATDGIPVGGFDTATIKILDDDHPRADIIGQWSGKLSLEGGMNYETSFNIEAVDNDTTYTKLRFDSGIDPVMGKGLKVKYSAVAKESDKGVVTVEIDSRQLSGYENYFISAVDPAGYFEEKIIFELKSDGTLELKSDYAIIAPSEEAGGYGLAALYLKGAIFTKQK